MIIVVENTYISLNPFSWNYQIIQKNIKNYLVKIFLRIILLTSSRKSDLKVD